MPGDSPRDPAFSCRGVLSSRRTVFSVGLVLFVFAVAGLFTALIQSRTALVTADPYSYLLFAQELARGHLHMTGPLAEAIAHFAENDELMQGPIWNTNVLPDGRTIFTIALGYPLLLSLALQVGGTWLYTSLNVGLLVLVVLALAWAVWEGWDRTLTGFLIGAAAGILFIHSHPATFLQFSNPWREPLFYLCVLGGMGGLIRFLATGRIPYLVPTGLLLGYACSVKEANAIYAMWFGLYLLGCSTWRRHPRPIRALAVFVGCGIVGLAPLLVQNLIATGNPLLSTQFMRATSNYGAQEVAAGLNRNNLGSTLSRYVLLYGMLPAFHPVLLGLAAVGVVAHIRRLGMRLLLGVFVVHLALYLQWGNADFRHSFFAHIPYSVFVIAGAVWLLALPFRWIPAVSGYRQWAGVVPLLVLASLAPPWQTDPQAGDTFSHRHAERLLDALETNMDEGGILLSNRVLRDVIGVYGTLPTLRLHELAAFHPAGDYAAVIDWLKENDHPVYFLDNRDLDPKNVGRIRWDKLDYRMLLDAFDLPPVAVLDSRSLRIETVTAGDPLTLYQVKSWQPGPGQQNLMVPREGAAFLFLNSRSAPPMEYRLQGTPFVPDPAAGFYQPVSGLPPGATVSFEWDHAGPVPALHDLRLVSWTEVIGQECGADALPSDESFFPEGGLIEEPENCRRFFAPMVLRVPVRQDPDLFTTVGLGLNLIGETTGLSLYVSLPGRAPMPIKAAMNAAWFPALLPDRGPATSGSVDVTLSGDDEAYLKITQVKSIPVRRSVSRRIADHEAGLALVGRMVPDVPGVGPHAWTAARNGEPAYAGRCFDDPRRSLNRFQAVFAHDGGSPTNQVTFVGGGLMSVEWAAVTNRLEVTPGAATQAFAHRGLYPNERVGEASYCWTEGSVEVLVPVTPEATRYELRMLLADGQKEPRTLEVALGGHTQTLELPKTPEEVALEFDLPAPAGPTLAALTLTVETWSPREVLGLEDDRELGFMFHGLTWQPAADGP